MREIKFRAWDKERKQMRYQGIELWYLGYIAHTKGNEFWKDCGNSINNFFIPTQGELMQFTGLHDRHGKEIWEGDVVREDETINLVKYSKSYCGFVPFVHGNGCGCCETYMIPNDCCVIGNIYENPELMGDKK